MIEDCKLVIEDPSLSTSQEQLSSENSPRGFLSTEVISSLEEIPAKGSERKEKKKEERKETRHRGTNALNESQEVQGRGVQGVRRLGVDSQTGTCKFSVVDVRHIGGPRKRGTHTHTHDQNQGRGSWLVRRCKLQSDKATTS